MDVMHAFLIRRLPPVHPGLTRREWQARRSRRRSLIQLAVAVMLTAGWMAVGVTVFSLVLF